MTTYEWTEHQMIVAPTEAGLTNVVKRVIATYVATDGVYTSSKVLNVALDPPDPMNFTAYESLTLLQVIGWLEAKVSVDDLDSYLDEQLQMQTLVTLPCPWEV